MNPSPSSPLFRRITSVATVLLAAACLMVLHLTGPNEAVLMCSLVPMVLSLTLIGRYILGPLDRAARHKMRRVQFTMADCLALMFLFQLPMAFVHSMADIRENRGVIVLDAFGWMACTAMWGLSVVTLSRAAIEIRWHRTLFLALVLPVAYFGSIAFTIIAVGLISGLFVDVFGWGRFVVRLCVAEAVLPVAFYLSARFVRQIVVAAEAGHAAESVTPLAGA